MDHSFEHPFQISQVHNGLKQVTVGNSLPAVTLASCQLVLLEDGSHVHVHTGSYGMREPRESED